MVRILSRRFTVLTSGLLLTGGAVLAEMPPETPEEPRVAARPETGPGLSGPSLSGPSLGSPTGTTTTETAPVTPAEPIAPAAPQAATPAAPAIVVPTTPATPVPATTVTTETVAAPAAEKSAPAKLTLADAIELARASQAKAKEVKDYTCSFVKRELLGAKVSPPESMVIKVRQKPFSVYLLCQGPLIAPGQEVIYVEGRNNGAAWAHTTGLKHRLVGTLSLDPKHARMMENNRHPVTELGIHYLLNTLVTEYEHAVALGPADVQVFKGAKVDGRESTCVQVAHPKPHKDLRFHVTRVYYDQQHGLPVRWEAYAFPPKAGAPPQLVEEYTYRGLKLNAGLTEADFDPRNRAYKFY